MLNPEEEREQLFEDHMDGWHERRTVENCPACEAEGDE